MSRKHWLPMLIIGSAILVGVGTGLLRGYFISSNSDTDDIEVIETDRRDIPKVGWNILRELDFETGEIEGSLKKYKNKVVQIPGFVVPLSDGSSEVEEFLLVPNAMACVHVPPPPPNQIVYVKLTKKVPIRELLRPVWVIGELEIVEEQSEYGSAGFKMTAQDLEAYKR